MITAKIYLIVSVTQLKNRSGAARLPGAANWSAGPRHIAASDKNASNDFRSRLTQRLLRRALRRA